MTGAINAEFVAALVTRDIIPPQPLIADGQLHRADAAGRNGKGDAAYVLHLDGVPAGGFENHRDGVGWENWCSRTQRELTASERELHKRRMAEARTQRDADERRRQAEAAERAAVIWGEADIECNGHPYLRAKHIGAHGARLRADKLIVPVRDHAGALISLQFIDHEGGKRFLTGGRMREGCFAIGEIVGAGTILIGEGYATAATLYEATDYPTVAAFDSGNLPPVAAMVRQRFPAAKIIIAADDDHLTRDKQGNLINPGIAKAREAAALVSGVVAIPDFGPDRPPDFTDFNDLGFFAGHDRVRAIIDAAVDDTALVDKPTPSFIDPWEDPAPPNWPGGILPARFEDMIAAKAERSGIDPGAVGISALLAVSGAAPKDCRFKPYGDTHDFVVPPILWAMTIARSGQRKTNLNDMFVALKNHRDAAWRDFQMQRDEWNALDREAQKERAKPHEPFACMVQDITPEKLARMLAENRRGTLLQRDELAAFFGFGRYTNDRGSHERSFYLEAYDGGAFLLQRLTHDATYVPHLAVAIFGSVQPRRLQQLKIDVLGEDGLLQRFIVIMLRKSAISQKPGTGSLTVPGRAEFNRIIGKLLDLGSLSGRQFSATPDGAEILYRLEGLGLDLSELTDYGPIFPEFCAKLHGTAARLAFVLHFLDNPAADMATVMPETIARADRLTREYVLPHARHFYAEASEEGPERTRAIGAWLLTGAPSRITASDFGKHVRSCRGLTSRLLNTALDPLIGGGWLIPETPYPGNTTWTLDARVREAMAHRVAAATDQRERNRRLAESIGR